MAFCIQCGEEIELETERCPACGRLVGASSIGQALERRPSEAQSSVLRFVALGVLVLLLGTAVFVWRRDGGTSVGSDELLAATRRAAPHLVRASAPGASADAGGVVLKSAGNSRIVALPASVAKVGTKLEVVAGEARYEGLVVLNGRDRTTEGLALALVDASALEPAPAALSAEVDAPVLALNANASLANAGTLLSRDADGVLVHDAPLADAARGYGLFDRNGRLLAYPALAASSGASLALSADALLSRVVVQPVTVPAGAAWVEPPVTLPAGAGLALACEGTRAPEVGLRFGGKGEVKARRGPGASWVVLVANPPAGALQAGYVSDVSAPVPLRCTLVALAGAAR